MISKIHILALPLTLLLLLFALVFVGTSRVNAQSVGNQEGTIGIQGVIPSDPPQQPPIVSLPGEGQGFTALPVNVTGVCEPGLEVRIYKNGVFAGSVICGEDGTYGILIDLFAGPNEIIAIQFDALGQPSPESTVRTINYDPPGGVADGVDQLVITSNFGNRGADPNTELTWPLALTGGVGPYAISVEWGDGNIEPISLDSEGQFQISHVYSEPGVYTLIVKATDSRGDTAFIQLVAIVNGPINETALDGEEAANQIIERQTYVTWPIYIMLFFVFSTFWLGRRYERRRIKEKLENREANIF